MHLLTLEGWSFIPGPREIPNPPLRSFEQHEIAEYEPGSVAEVILAYPGMSSIHPPDPSWWEWRVEWSVFGRLIRLDMTLFEVEPPLWGGSVLELKCEEIDLLNLWNWLRRSLPSIWLHNRDCEIHTPESFLRWLER